MTVYVAFGREQADPSHPNGYDERLCRALIDDQLGPLPTADVVILNVGHWRGEPHAWIALALAEYLTEQARVHIWGRTTSVQRAWINELARARTAVAKRRALERAGRVPGPAVDWISQRGPNE